MHTEHATHHHPNPTTPLNRPYARPTIWALAVLGGVILTLWLAGTPPGVLGKADAVGYAICHRIEARTFHAHDRPLPLCARCTGIYLGVITALVIIAARGRLRAARLPGIPVLAVMVALGLTYAVDGLNSYLSIFAFYTPPYQPHNTLRLLTGLSFGLALITIVLPVINAIAWRAPQDAAPVASLRELAALYAAAAGVAVAVLLQIDALLVVLGLISALGVVLMFVIIGAVLFLTLTRRENTLTRWRDLAFPALAGLTFAVAVIGGIDLVRYLFTGTWDGFTLPGA